MNRGQIKQQALLLYYAATNKHDLDDIQLDTMLDMMNKKYWRSAVRSVGSLFAKDTSDLVSSSNGQIDYSGNLYFKNDIPLQAAVNVGYAQYWTNTNATVTHNDAVAPDESNTATRVTDTVTNAAHTLAITGPLAVYQSGCVTVYAKAGTGTFIYLSASANGANAWFNLQTGTLATNLTGQIATITPVPANGFPQSIGVTSAPSPVVSPSGWYKCTVQTAPGVNADRFTVGFSATDGVASYAGTGLTWYLWGARRGFSDNMVDPNGVYMPLAVEIKYLGRYIHLDYELPQDRYIYNIAFGQVQVLIPSAWTLMGEKVILLPLVAQNQTVRMSFVSNLPDWVSDSQEALQGQLRTFHPLLAYETAAAFLPPASDRSAIIGPLAELRQQWADYMASRQRQDGRKIRFVPYE